MNPNDLLPFNLTPEQLPSVIDAQIRAVHDLEEKIKEAKSRAETAQESAANAHKKSAGFGKKKEAIEALQDATYDLSKSQDALVESQELNFQLHEKLGTVIRYLFGLGVSNIASNRIVVRQIELHLKNASEEELDDLARQELQNVVKQLKAQEDLMSKQETLSQKLRDLTKDSAVVQGKTDQLAEQLQIQGARIQTQAHWIANQTEKWEQHSHDEEQQNKKIDTCIQKGREHDLLIAEGEAKDQDQDNLIRQQVEKSKEHDRLLAKSIAKDSELEKSIVQQLEKYKQHDQRIEACLLQSKKLQNRLDAQKEALTNVTKQNDLQERTLEELSKKIEEQTNLLQQIQDEVLQKSKDFQKDSAQKADKKLLIPSYVMAATALLFTILQFFI